MKKLLVPLTNLEIIVGRALQKREQYNPYWKIPWKFL